MTQPARAHEFLQTPSPERIAVGLCTYKRPEGLQRALQHVAASITEAVLATTATGGLIIVVDNDGASERTGQIIDEARARGGPRVELIVERRPGISAARNAMIARADELGIGLLAMLDDDEWPSPGWLSALLARREDAQAHIVGGPVRPDFGPAHAHLDQYARFWAVEAQQLDGKPFVFCTCNCLIDLLALRGVARPFFDDSLGLSGSEDTVFFRRLFYRGHPMAWADEAILYEEVPPDRATVGWLRRRRFAAGSQAVSWEGRDRGPLRPVLKTLLVTARLAIYPLIGADRGWLGWLLQFDRVRGRYAAHLGQDLVQAYARAEPESPGPLGKACR